MRYILKIGTTGLSPIKDHIYRIYIKSVDMNREWDKYIVDCPISAIQNHPEFSPSFKAETIAKVQGGITFESAIKVVKSVIENNEIIGFGVNFDINFLLYKLNFKNISLNLSKTTIYDLCEKEQELYKFHIENVYEREVKKQYDSVKHFDVAYNAQCYEEIYQVLNNISPASKSIWATNRYVDDKGKLRVGKYKGLALGDKGIPKTYYQWLYDQDDMMIKLIIQKLHLL